MTKETIMGWVRHLLTFGGGFAANAGYVTDDAVTMIVGAIVTVVGVIWSAIEKYTAADDLAKAVAAPAGETG